MKEFLIMMAMAIIFGWMFAHSLEKEQELIDKHCKGLSGYEYGECQASIY